MAKLVPKKRIIQEDFVPIVGRIAAAASDHKAKDLKAYDVRSLTVIADAFVICTATSEPQMKAIFNAVRREMKTSIKQNRHMAAEPSANWLVLDLNDVIFHVFRQEARAFYDLDGLWADALEIELSEFTGE